MNYKTPTEFNRIRFFNKGCKGKLIILIIKRLDPNY